MTHTEPGEGEALQSLLKRKSVMVSEVEPVFKGYLGSARYNEAYRIFALLIRYCCNTVK